MSLTARLTSGVDTLLLEPISGDSCSVRSARRPVRSRELGRATGNSSPPVHLRRRPSQGRRTAVAPCSLKRRLMPFIGPCELAAARVASPESLGWHDGQRPRRSHQENQAAERESFGEVVLPGACGQRSGALNPDLPADALDAAERKVTCYASRPRSSRTTAASTGCSSTASRSKYPPGTAASRGVLHPAHRLRRSRQQRLARRQPVHRRRGRRNRRPDVVVFVNGLPLGVFELKNPADEDATIWTAFNQLQTYKTEIPALFAYNAAARRLRRRARRGSGSLTRRRERFMPWRTIDGESARAAPRTQLEVLLQRRVRQAALPRSRPALRRLRGRGGATVAQEDRGVSPVPRRRGRRSQRRRASRPRAATGAAASSGTPRAPARA